MKTVIKTFLLICGTLALVARANAAEAPAPAAPSPDEALQSLIDGNARYVSGSVEHPHQDGARRSETVSGGQHPFATILSCSDSRGPVEIVFDQGLGDVFVV